MSVPLRDRHREAQPLIPGDPNKPPGWVRIAVLEQYREEMAWLADQIQDEIRTGTPGSDIAVLVPARSDFPELMAALSERGVPYEVRGIDGLIDRELRLRTDAESVGSRARAGNQGPFVGNPSGGPAGDGRRAAPRVAAVLLPVGPAALAGPLHALQIGRAHV